MTTTSIPTRTPRRRKLVITLGAVLLILVGYTTWANLRTVTLTHSVDIAAPTSVVWEVLTDLEAYPQWNPFMVEAAGSVSEGDKLTILLRDAAGDDMEISPSSSPSMRIASCVGWEAFHRACCSTASTDSNCGRDRKSTRLNSSH